MTACLRCGCESPQPFRFCPECGTEAGPAVRELRKTATAGFSDIVGSTGLGNAGARAPRTWGVRTEGSRARSALPRGDAREAPPVVADVGAVAGDSTRARARALEAVELYERKGDLVSVALARERA